MMRNFYIFLVTLSAMPVSMYAQDTIPDSTKFVRSTLNDSCYTYVKQMPEFVGGTEAFQRHLINNVRYPQMEKEKGIMGTVYISFTVTSTGKIVEVTCHKGVEGGPGLCREGIRVISLMPDWEPGVLDGKAVPVIMTIPIRFVLQEDDPPKEKKKRGRK